jgi:hypothetical protein
VAAFWLVIEHFLLKVAQLFRKQRQNESKTHSANAKNLQIFSKISRNSCKSSKSFRINIPEFRMDLELFCLSTANLDDIWRHQKKCKTKPDFSEKW